MTNTTYRHAAVSGDLDEATGVITLMLAMPGKANVINASFGEGLRGAMAWIESCETKRGVIIGSDHKDFCAGADIDSLYAKTSAAELYEEVRALGGLFRSIETCGVPVVAALTGTALGGGFELALACHHRIALDTDAIKFGLPEVQLGVIPGAGGTQRLPRLIGIQAAAELILQGKELRATAALKAGLVDALAADAEDLRAQALRFIETHPKAKQPWDTKGSKIPGPQPDSPDARNMLMAASGMLRKKTAGVFQAPERALSAISEGLKLDIDTALDVEARYFVELALSDACKDMIRTLWFSRNAAMKHEGLPRHEGADFESVGIIGAGMMGAGLAFVCADAGYTVVIKDITEEALDGARAHVEGLVKKRRKHLPDEARDAILRRVTYALDAPALEGVDLVIEAVFENLALKHAVNTELEPLMNAQGVWASNTSALPITDVGNPRAPRGLHRPALLLPVEQMPLLEIITTETTSEETLARCLAFCRRIKKLPVVVGDGYAFYTTRVFSAFIMEGANLVAEGQDPVLIEWAARAAGMVVPPLQVFDEVTLTLGVKANEQGRAYLGDAVDSPGMELVRTLVEQGRHGKASGAGFYHYEGGKRRGVWPGLAEHVRERQTSMSVEDLGRRLLLAQAVQAVRALELGILRSPRDGDVAAVFGIGFAPHTGGPFGWLDRQDLVAVVAELERLASERGARFEPPALLRTMAAAGERFFETPRP